MSFVSTGNKSAGSHGPEITTPPIAGESGGMSAGSAATGVAEKYRRARKRHRRICLGRCQNLLGW